jgi:hypothetical protein
VTGVSVSYDMVSSALSGGVASNYVARIKFRLHVAVTSRWKLDGTKLDS